jgi:hypothetical protein
MKRFSFQFNYNATINLSENDFLLALLLEQQNKRVEHQTVMLLPRGEDERRERRDEKWHLSWYFLAPFPRLVPADP